MNRFLDLLATRDCLLADGATGTNLFAVGLPTGHSPELWNAENPAAIGALHRGFVEAGSDIVLSNSFGGNRFRLKLHGAEDRVAELNERAAAIAREQADRAGRTVVVAGSMGPTGELFEPLGALTPESAREAFAEQAEALRAGGADVIWIETMSAREEVEAAVAGAAVTGLPVVVTMSFDTSGRTMMGLTPPEHATLCATLTPAPCGCGSNCGVGAAEVVAGILAMAHVAAPGQVLVAKANCGIPEFIDGKIHYNGSPELMAGYAGLARDAGARVIGGCCGTTAAHVRAMREALDAHVASAAPELARVEAELGPVSDGARRLCGGGGDEPVSARTGTRRRRRE